MDVKEAGAEDEPFEDYVPLWLLLTAHDSRWGDPFAPATVVEAIEKQGIMGFDRVGRFKWYSKTTSQVQEAIEAVERFYGDIETPGADLHEMELRLDDSSPLWRYGWPAPQTTSLARIEAKLKVSASNNISRHLNTTRVLVGLLTSVILGKVDCKRHPSFASLDELTKFLEENARVYSLDGLKGDSLKEKIEDANGRFAEACQSKKN